MLSQKSQYAFRALTMLVHQYQKGPLLIADIAAQKNIPLKFLEAILLDLRRAGILESKKGKGGGYYLVQHPKKTTIADVVRIVNGPIAMLPCVSLHFYRKCDNCDEQNCGLHGIMIAARDATLKVLERRTLKDLTTGDEGI